MSNIYIQEPPTLGKVLLQTTVGDIDIELWSKEAPKACRNFIQLCLEGYYHGNIFHRVVKGFIAQGGDPTGTGDGGESIYGSPFRDEFHSRLRFVRRGLVAMANAGKDDNGSQFFFTLGASPELQNKHTIFGKVTGHTLYNMLKLEDADVDADDRPVYPHKIIKTEVLMNPFDDIVPREKQIAEPGKQEKKKSKSKATKNYKLLSFGDEAEEDELETDAAAKEMRGRSKSSHDLTKDPKLSSVPAVEMIDDRLEGDVSSDDGNDQPVSDGKGTPAAPVMQLRGVVVPVDDEIDKKNKRKGEALPENPKSESEMDGTLDQVKKKLKKEPVERNKEKQPTVPDRTEKEPPNRTDEIKKEYQQLKKEMLGEKNKDIKTEETEEKKFVENLDVAEYQKEKEKYKEKTKKTGKKGSAREEQTLALLAKFREKLQSVREKDPDVDEEVKEEQITDNDEGWMSHVLRFDEDEAPVTVAKDANMRDQDWYDIDDPRNPINQRRREANNTSIEGNRSGRDIPREEPGISTKDNTTWSDREKSKLYSSKGGNQHRPEKSRGTSSETRISSKDVNRSGRDSKRDTRTDERSYSRSKR